MMFVETTCPNCGIEPRRHGDVRDVNMPDCPLTPEQASNAIATQVAVREALMQILNAFPSFWQR